MDSAADSPSRTLRAKKPTASSPPLFNPGPSGPTTFFLRSEKDMEKSMQRGRKPSRNADSSLEDALQQANLSGAVGDSTFGVQSLEDTINSTPAPSSDSSLSRTVSNVSDASAEAGADVSMPTGRKRKAGNPVHPKILATGQRIISSEHSVQTSASPISLRSAESPLRATGRRNSYSSSINLSRPLTPLRMSPRPESVMPSTPRSGSPKSFRLSDEEQSIASDTGSQAIQSSSGGEDDDVSNHNAEKSNAMPQLVMPSISIPARRPFTQKGKQMGRLKIMVVGPRNIGKTSLIQSMCRVVEDIVHVDSAIVTGSSVKSNQIDRILEIGASTRPYPSWWIDVESKRILPRRKSVGDGVLERNLTFIDTPGLDTDESTQAILRHFSDSLTRMGHMDRMHDSELINMLSGEGGAQIDVVLFLFDPVATSETAALSDTQTKLLKYLCKWTNVIPLIGRSDSVSADEVEARKQQLLNTFKDLDVRLCEPHASTEPRDDSQEVTVPADAPSVPYAVSSALGDDSETLDASILMSSDYLQPFLPSELNTLVTQLLEPNNMARWRHLSAAKFLLWRHEHLSSHIDLRKQTFGSPSFAPGSPGAANTDSIPDEPSNVLVPHGSSSYFRSVSPSASEASAPVAGNSENVVATSTQALARYNDQTRTSEPFRQVRLAKWAQDLQRSLENERRRYAQIFTSSLSTGGTSSLSPDGATGTASSDAEKALVANSPSQLRSRPPKGRLGGDLGIIDPRDPLGVLAFTQVFKQRGWFALQIVGSCGLLGAVMWWVARNWTDFIKQDLLGWDGQASAMNMTAVPAPSSSPTERSWLDAADWRNLLGMGR